MNSKKRNSGLFVLIGLLFAIVVSFSGCIGEENKSEENNTPGNLSADEHNNLGKSLYNSNDLSGAEREFRKAIEIDPGYEEAHANLGSLLHDLKRYDEAEKEYKEAIKINPEDSEAHNNLGVLLKDLKRYDEAEKEYKEAIKIHPEFAIAYYNLGYLLYDLKRYDEAKKELRTAADLFTKEGDSKKANAVEELLKTL